MRSWSGKILNDKYRIDTDLLDIEITDEPLVVLCYGKVIVENDPTHVVSRPTGRKDYQFLYIKNGQIEFQNDNNTEILDKNTLILIKPGIPQYRKILCENQSCAHMFVHFSGNAVEELLNKYDINKSIFHFDEKFNIFEEIINRMEAGKGSRHHEDLCNTLLKEFFIILSDKTKHNTAQKQGFKSLLKLMEDTCTNNYPIKFYADQIHFSEVYFIRFFKKAMGVSPHKYLMIKKINKATFMLIHTNDSIKTISEQLGFANQHYFSKVFYDFYKMSPSEYRSLEKTKKSPLA